MKVYIFMKRRLKILDESFHLSIISIKIYKSEPTNYLQIQWSFYWEIQSKIEIIFHL